MKLVSSSPAEQSAEKSESQDSKDPKFTCRGNLLRRSFPEISETRNYPRKLRYRNYREPNNALTNYHCYYYPHYSGKAAFLEIVSLNPSYSTCREISYFSNSSVSPFSRSATRAPFVPISVKKSPLLSLSSFHLLIRKLSYLRAHSTTNCRWQTQRGERSTFPTDGFAFLIAEGLNPVAARRRI